MRSTRREKNRGKHIKLFNYLNLFFNNKNIYVLWGLERVKHMTRAHKPQEKWQCTIL